MDFIKWIFIFNCCSLSSEESYHLVRLTLRRSSTALKVVTEGYPATVTSMSLTKGESLTKNSYMSYAISPIVFWTVTFTFTVSLYPIFINMLLFSRTSWYVMLCVKSASYENICLSGSIGSIYCHSMDVILPPPVLLMSAFRYTILSLGTRLMKPRLNIFTWRNFGCDTTWHK
jgi:hypothetical protein